MHNPREETPSTPYRDAPGVHTELLRCPAPRVGPARAYSRAVHRQACHALASTRHTLTDAPRLSPPSAPRPAWAPRRCSTTLRCASARPRAARLARCRRAPTQVSLRTQPTAQPHTVLTVVYASARACRGDLASRPYTTRIPVAPKDSCNSHQKQKHAQVRVCVRVSVRCRSMCQ